MTNRIAIWLGLIIAVFVAVDLWFELGMVPYLARKVLDLIRAVAIWR